MNPTTSGSAPAFPAPMKYNRHTPCDNCPFRNDIRPFITAERVEEIFGNAFPCHKTTQHDDEGEHIVTNREQHCAGSLILHEKMKQPHQMMRIMERINQYDYKKLDMTAPVYHDLEEMLAAHEEANV